MIPLGSYTIGRCVVKRTNPAVASATLDLEKAVLTKPSGPRVLGKPEVHPTLAAVADDCHLMVEVVLALGVSGLLTASVIIVDSTIVVVVDGTVHNVLFGEVVKHDSPLLPETGFNNCNSSKSRTASTLALVLNRGNPSLLHPAP